MLLSDFLLHLIEKETAVVTGKAELVVDPEWEKTICAWDWVHRGELAFEAPALSLAAAEWAAIRLYRSCQAVVCREMDTDAIHQYLAEPLLLPRSPSVEYSVDLLFRFLPDLIALARRLERNDPLVAELMTLAQTWPLSSVGIEGLEKVDPSLLMSNSSLRQLYVDRILETEDSSRLSCLAVREAIQVSLGAFPEMAASIAAAAKS